MKVELTEEAKNYISVAEMPAVKQIIKDMKDDDNIIGYAQDAACVASGWFGFEILKAEASIAKNCRVWNLYGENTGDLDVYLDIYAFNNYAGFYKIGAYLSDIWSICEDNAEELKEHMYIRAYMAIQK